MKKDFIELIKALIPLLLVIIICWCFFKFIVINACDLLGIEPTIKNILTVSFFMNR